jgi:hypothetical protein
MSQNKPSKYWSRQRQIAYDMEQADRKPTADAKQAEKDAAKMRIQDALDHLSADEAIEFLSYIVEAIKKHQREFPR